ncbi:MAG: hypothetical protein LBQ59_02925 [Candidatus Peribacteria bacterium]|jgi:hypothetical protein|nr:hypothetical protein [Candidatus Peribacteria bacterium]
MKIFLKSLKIIALVLCFCIVNTEINAETITLNVQNNAEKAALVEKYLI